MGTLNELIEHGLWLAQEHHHQICQEVIAHDPIEACGLVSGSANHSHKVYPITNELHSQVRFRMHPQEMINALLEMETQGCDLLAIYHSHPQGPPRPSPTDLAEFAYPGTVYLIYSPVAGARPEGRREWIWRAFLIHGGVVSDILLHIE